MDVEVLPFDPEHACAPCGTEGASPVYHARPVAVVFGGPQWPCEAASEKLGPHLCFRCGVCGFTWIEHTSSGMGLLPGS